MRLPLSSITALARAGAIDRAWAAFEDGNYQLALDDPSALAVKGRLLKDLAHCAPLNDRAAKLAEAASAYLAADAESPQPYLLINAAACHMLAGQVGLAHTEALDVLERLRPSVAVNETPYWRSATLAEANLILGNVREADAWLGEAIALDPTGYDDRAVTLRQFSRLIAAHGGDATWLDKHRPPKSLHFAGHLGVAADTSAGLRGEVDAILAVEQIGFGYGALAAGADIVIAESLLACGAELNIILPATIPDFQALSVTPYGDDWAVRFETCLAAAASVRIATDVGSDQFEPMATAFAAELAMGSAMFNARQMESRPVQLLVIDEGEGPFGSGALTARDGTTWAQTGQAQRRIITPRSAAVPPSSRKPEGRPDRRLMALLRVDYRGLQGLSDAAYATILDDQIAPFETAMESLSVTPVFMQSVTNGRIFAFANPVSATIFAHDLLALNGDLPITLCGHYGLVHDSGKEVRGAALSLLDDIAAAAVSSVLTVSESYATALQIGGGRCIAVYVGDAHSGPADVQTRLFTLSS